MDEFLTTLDAIIGHKSPFGRGSDCYQALFAWVHGYDAGNAGGLLAGFREWLVVRRDGGNNLTWMALVLDSAIPLSSRSPQGAEQDAAANRHVIDTLFQLLSDFFQERRDRGLAEIFADYHRWLCRQEWYDDRGLD